MIVLKRTGQEIAMEPGRDVWWDEFVKDAPAYCAAEKMDAEDMLYLLYTSGSTGKPKGIVHTTGGYLTGVYATTKWVFDLHDTDVYWCTADIGWVTGHSYVVYGPLANGATTVMYEGTPDFPDKDRFWRIVEKHGVTICYTAPTAIRTFMRWGDEYPKRCDLSSLRLLGTRRRADQSRGLGLVLEGDRGRPLPCGRHLVADGDGAYPHHAAARASPRSSPGRRPGPSPASRRRSSTTRASRPRPAIWSSRHRGRACCAASTATRSASSPSTGAGTRGSTSPATVPSIDEDGYFWLLGRVDDVMNISGHRVSTMEVESALVDHPLVAEAAVIGRPHEIKGQAIAAFVTIRDGNKGTKELMEELKAHVTKKIGALARPDDLIWAADLPKTRSGKIMRRLLRDIAEGKALGDTTTLADPAVVSRLKEQYGEEE